MTVVLADAYPNSSICGIPYLISGEVSDWRDLAHRGAPDLEAAGVTLLANTYAHRVDVPGHRVAVRLDDARDHVVPYDRLVIATGAEPVVPHIGGLRGEPGLSSAEGLHLLHTMTDTRRVVADLEERVPTSALIVGAGYIGLEMADALTVRGIQLTLVEQLPQVLPTVDRDIAEVVHAELTSHGVEVLTARP